MKRGAIVLGGQELPLFVTETRRELVEGMRGVRQLPSPMAGLLMVFRGPPRPRQLTMQGVILDLDAFALSFDGRSGGHVVDQVRMKSDSSHAYRLEACALVLELPAGRFDRSMVGDPWRA